MAFDRDTDSQEADVSRTVVEQAHIGNDLFRELADDYHVRLPKMQFVVGKDNANRPAVFVLANKVEGHNLSKLVDETDSTPLSSADKKRLISEFDDLILSLGSYYFDVIKSGESGKEYLCDVDSFSQYIFGQQKGDSVSHIYLVDLDPLFDKINSSYDFVNAINDVGNIIAGIPDYEERFGGRLIKSRQRLLEIISGLVPLLEKHPSVDNFVRR
ncbi:MAG: hypothetical protein WC473_00685 [Patescibacteria group bacterium]